MTRTLQPTLHAGTRSRLALLALLVATGLALTPASSEAEFGLLGSQTRVSMMGDETTTGAGREPLDAFSSVVAYNPTANEYLVVWDGDDNLGGLVDNEVEIWAQRLSGAGAPLGARIRISDMGLDGSNSFGSESPAVAYNPVANEFLVVWTGEDNIPPLVDDEFEIFGQRLTAAGAETGPNDFRISDMGTNGSTSFDARNPEVVYNPTANEYLVAWRGDDNTPPLVDGEYEIYGQRLSAASATEIGVNDFRISDMGNEATVGAGRANLDAQTSDVAFNSIANEYLVTWSGDDEGVSLIDDEFEIFGQRLTAAGVETGANDFRISDMGPINGPNSYEASEPAIAYNPSANEYLVTWRGDDNTAPLVNDEFEIFGQRLSGASGADTGENDFRISDMGPDSNINFAGIQPAVAYNPGANEYLVTWRGEDDIAPLVNNELEIFGQRLSGAAGAPAGANDFRISFMGPDGNTSFAASNPAVASNPAASEALVVWTGDDNTAPLIDDEFEIFGRRLGELPVAPPPEGDPPPGGDPPPLLRAAATLTSFKLARNGKSLLLEIACPANSLDCADGSVKLKTRNRVARPKRREGVAKRRRLALGSAKFSIPSGESASVRLRLNSTALKLLAEGPVKALATLTVPDGDSPSLRSTKRLTIRPRR